MGETGRDRLPIRPGGGPLTLSSNGRPLQRQGRFDRGLLGLLWIFVPFAIFGIKGLLRQLVAEQRRTNEILSRVHGDRIPPPAPEPQPFRVAPYP
ncbi:hypothetical protein [Stenotrophomonas sp. PS02301]|uniref:hypothetical protein n=1 Tax=Stenotrophomonas sp. PS02301 TaxID=2991427 RepID=UPI002499E459|nr:hypothetical protein [Stenotrophomonas sp. PS02301]